MEPDVITYALSAISLAVSAWVIWRSRGLADQAMEDWVSRGPHDPLYEAAVRSRLNRRENKRLTRALSERGSSLS